MLRLILRGMFVVVIVLTALIRSAKAAPDAPSDLDMSFASFGTGGQVVTTGTEGTGHSMVLQPDDKIVVAGNTGLGWFVRRYLPNGTPDVTFGQNGLATPPHRKRPRSLWGMRPPTAAPR